LLDALALAAIRVPLDCSLGDFTSIATSLLK